MLLLRKTTGYLGVSLTDGERTNLADSDILLLKCLSRFLLKIEFIRRLALELEVFSTKRMVVRRYMDADLKLLESLCLDSSVWTYSTRDWSAVTDPALIYLNELHLKYTNQSYGVYAAFLDDNSYVGEVGVYSESLTNRRVNVGYNLLSKYWNRGLATELLSGFVELLREASCIERIEATVLSENKASIRVLEKTGFLHEGTLRKYVYLDGNSRDVAYFSIIP